jgi:circadian clock protein KaiC
LAKKKPARRVRAPQPLVKARTGIAGLDEITMGGLPKGRATLVAGGAGSGKTLFGVAFLVRGALDFDEPGVLVTFEETATDIAENVRSLGIDIERLVARGRLVIDHVRIERSEIHETGEYDLEGLFVRLDHAVRAVGARRVVIDTLEVLFAGLSDAAILRAELRRLFGWLKDRRLTTIITAERGTS